ncbi:winged helix-turn-helix domain-containing protein [Vibrio mediterranei]|uniref:OmpR/PhoB-type domain-containing protein n=1 Tax=Vibrio mediterranei TaxID=689 RepID=A0AAN1FN50_9VIBR|nr:hypothetical protein BSZ05_26030 [Vibrio mediterranei]
MKYIIVNDEHLSFDSKTKIITSSNGRDITLSCKERNVLDYLFTNANKVVSRQELQKCIGETKQNDAQSISIVVFGLRKKLSSLCKINIIITVRGKGYKLDNYIRLANSPKQLYSIKLVSILVILLSISTVVKFNTGHLLSRWNHYFYLINEQRNHNEFYGVYEVYCTVDGTRRTTLFRKSEHVSSFIGTHCSREHLLEVNFKSPSKKS